MEIEEQKSNVEQEFNQQIQDLQAAIERVGLRQDELKAFIFDVSATIKKLQENLDSLPKEAYDAKGKFYLAIQKNNELISRYYDTISSFEAVRHRYQQDIGRLTKDKLYFINIELRRVEDKFDNTSASMSKFTKEIRELISTIAENPVISKKLIGSVEDKPEYSME